VKLVVELEALQEVGVAVKDSPAALERVKQLILSSPSLTDVIGIRGVEEEPKDELAEQALAFLVEHSGSWFTTQAVAKGIKTGQERLLLTRLKDLKEDGEIEWRKKGQGYEWRAIS
jgi:hypothetical protein